MSTTYVTVPEYQPSSATLVVGDPFYKASRSTQNVAVRRTGLDVGTIAIIGIPVGILFVWLLLRRR